MSTAIGLVETVIREMTKDLESYKKYNEIVIKEKFTGDGVSESTEVLKAMLGIYGKCHALAVFMQKAVLSLGGDDEVLKGLALVHLNDSIQKEILWVGSEACKIVDEYNKDLS